MTSQDSCQGTLLLTYQRKEKLFVKIFTSVFKEIESYIKRTDHKLHQKENELKSEDSKEKLFLRELYW